MSGQRKFYTFRGYALASAQQRDGLTPSMEDYLEMIYRLSQAEGYTRMLELAAALHVQPPSASRMVQRLAEENLLVYEKYSIIRLTPQGEKIGRYLLARHNILEDFLRLLGLEDVLEDAEKIEHNISAAALARLEDLLAFFQQNTYCQTQWESFRAQDNKKNKEPHGS
ncbi:MAG: transcriptional regulator MntR [Firmicutes bacterium]|nr:transcriptional regulator MntR [Bacillota bacterium]